MTFHQIYGLHMRPRAIAELEHSQQMDDRTEWSAVAVGDSEISPADPAPL